MATIVAIPPPAPLSPGYRIDLTTPHDKEVTSRNRRERWAVLLGTTALAFLGPTTLTTFLGWLVGLPVAGFWIGLPLAYHPTTIVLKRGIVRNPQWQGSVTQDEFRGNPVEYGPGLHPSDLWESRSEVGNIPLSPIDEEFVIEVPTKTAKVKMTVFFQWAPDIQKMNRFLGVKDEVTIRKGFTPFLESFLAGALAKKTAAGVREMVETMNQALAVRFMGTPDPTTGKTPTDFEDGYGIKTVSIRITRVELPPDVQRTLDALDEAQRLGEIVAIWLGLPYAKLKKELRAKNISAEDFAKHLEQAMIISGNATFNVQKVDVPGLVTRLLK